jgi:fatty acid desaturase
VKWYRTPIDPGLLKTLQRRSDLLGAAQTLGYLGVLAMSAGSAFYSAGRWPWWSTVLLTFLHGTCFAFQINAVHELGHGTVFRSSAVNRFFQRIFAFLGWINPHTFGPSHARHHQFTLHPPADLEVVLPSKLTVRDFLKAGFVNPWYLTWAIGEALRLARGEFRGEWEIALFPPDDAERRRSAIAWARLLLAGHAAIVIGSLGAAAAGHPRFLMLPVLTTFGKGYGGWLFFLCNSAQHIGLKDNVADFRLCARTIVLNPVARFLYWNMNFHIEHHMYTQVPCYRLGALHRAIRHDLPAAPLGLLATWRQIATIQACQARDPCYQHHQVCPGGHGTN